MGKKTGPKPVDISGLKFNRLKALHPVDDKKWMFECDCGIIKPINKAHVKTGIVRSCGCLALEKARTGDSRRKHGLSHSPEYVSWNSMMNRCNNSNDPNYVNYGAKGIKVCERWMKFENFLEDMGRRPNGTSIDRLNFDGDYELSNCRWATRTEQNSHLRTCVYLTANGKTQNLGAWARELGVSTTCLRSRIKNGLNHEDIVNLPFGRGISLAKRKA